MFKCIAEEFKKHHLKHMVVKDERVLSYYNLDTAKECIVFWGADDVPISSVNKVREALGNHMAVCLFAFVRRSRLNQEQIPDAIYLDSSGVSYKGEFYDPRVQEVLNRKEGLLIDLSLNQNAWGSYIMRSAKTSCKIGYSTGHDIDFDRVRDIDDFMNRLFELLTKINAY